MPKDNKKLLSFKRAEDREAEHENDLEYPGRDCIQMQIQSLLQHKQQRQYW